MGNAKAEPDNRTALSRVLFTARSRGLDTRELLLIVAQEYAKERQFSSEEKMTLRLVTAKASIFATLAVLTKEIALRMLRYPLGQPLDILFSVSGLSIIALFVWQVKRNYPRYWLSLPSALAGEETRNNEQIWLESLILGNTPPGSAISAEWQVCLDRERYEGIDYHKERLLLMQLWTADLHTKALERQRLFVEKLFVFELFSLTISTCLLFLIPGSKVFL